MTRHEDISPEYTGRKLRELAGKIIDNQAVMTLATAEDGAAWAAPVYFVFRKSGFYFLSDPEARHIRESLEGGKAAASIHAPAATWQEIRGVQMSGTIRREKSPMEAAAAIAAYLKKFPFTREFFKPGEIPDLEAFGNRFRVRLYRFTPSLIYYLDNQIRFGFREEIRL
ncbi:MAG: pyridoxamine 5'-phosphate oxidase family protein [Deltaproteobacteria bacterium]|nr:pyridoxamine 5'-phosphate oxidase family protein [Deltaproteobacteria bacterium]MBW1817918.1 pyridoxamine 5'-phosphate oxidase family protein [Deltaproteobacteria bacterium]